MGQTKSTNVLNGGTNQLLNQQQSFLTAINDNYVRWIKSFLKNPSLSPLYFQFNYSLRKPYLPQDSYVTPIIIAILNNKIEIVKIIIQFQSNPINSASVPSSPSPTNPFNPSTYKEHGLPLFHYAIASESIEMMDYILSLYSKTMASTSSTTSKPTITSNESPPLLVDTIISDIKRNSLQFAANYLKLEQVQHLIEHFKCNPLITNINGSNILHFAVDRKIVDIPMFEYLMSLKGVNDMLHNTNKFGYSLLSYSVASNINLDFFHYLRQQYNLDIDVITARGDNILQQAISNPLLDENMIDEIININPKWLNSVDDTHPPLFTAIYYNRLNIVQNLIQKHHIDPLSIKYYGSECVLHAAAKSIEDSIEMFEYLLSLDGVEELLEHKDEEGFTPLLQLASENKPNSFKYLIEQHSANIHCKNNEGFAVSHCFSYRGNIEMIDFIHNINPDFINQQDDEGLSPLMFAIMNDQLSMVKHLIEQYEVNFDDVPIIGNQSVLHLATQNGSIELADYLIGLNNTFIGSMDINGCTPLLYACVIGNNKLIHRLINQYNANSFIVDEHERNMMHLVLYSNNVDLIKDIATIFQNQQPPTTLQFTLPNGYPRLTGEWPDRVESPLHYAIEQSKLAGVKQLVRLKANITTTNTISRFDDQFGTILKFSYHYAHENNDYSIFEYLLSDECLADWNSEELKFNDETTIQIYRQKDPIQPQLDINHSDEHYTLLSYAASKCDFTAIKLLIERKANIYTVDDDEDGNILHVLVDNTERDEQSQDKLLNYINYLVSLPEINVEQLLTQTTSHDQSTPLLYAAYQCSFSVIQQLINLKANINDVDYDNNSLIHHVTMNSRFSIIYDFIQNYPQLIQQSLYEHNNHGYTPFHISILTIQGDKLRILYDVGDDFQHDTDDVDDDFQHRTDGDDDSQHDRIMTNDKGNSTNNTNNTEFNFHNQDITTLIEYDRTLLLQKKTNETILHVAVQARVELPTRLAGLIEAVINHIDILFSPTL